MAVSIKQLIFLLCVVLTFSNGELEPKPHHQHSLENLLDQLKSHVSLLESSIHERIRLLRSKDERIRKMEGIINEKSKSVEALQSEVDSLQSRGASDRKEQPRKSYARIGELEMQVEELRNEIESEVQIKDELEIRASVAETKINELNLKLESLQKVDEEQKIRIRETEYALQLAQGEIMNLKFEADSGSNKLIEVHGEWLPSWLAVGLGHHFQKWIPMLEHWWSKCTTHLLAGISTLTSKTIELFHTSKNSVIHHAVNIQEMAKPYLKEAKQFTQPYINQVATTARPHIDKLCVVLKPFTRRTIHAYKNFVEFTTIYHHQVQGLLKSNKITRNLATKELAWFAATALLSIPVIFMFKLYSSILRKKAKKHRHRSRTKPLHRGTKRSRAAC